MKIFSNMNTHADQISSNATLIDQPGDYVIDLSDVGDIIVCDTTLGTINITGFVNGKQGESIKILKSIKKGSLWLRHDDINAAQKIQITNATDYQITKFCYVVLLCYDNNFYINKA